MLTVGEKIYSDVSGRTYTITWASDIITQAEVGFASTPSDGDVYFIKRLLNIKYPTESSLGSPRLKEELRKKCDIHFRKYSALYRSIKAGCGSDGACVPIEDYFRDGAFYYTVYQRINAESLSLADIAALKKLEKYKLLLRLVQGLQPLHTQGVIHGDLKPDNILVKRDGESWWIRLIDMNDCYHAGEPNLPGEVVGTPDYYSPELTEYNTYEVEDFEDKEEMTRVQNLANTLTTKSDIFALGIIFCEFFSGVRPQINNDKIENLAEAATKRAISFPIGLPDAFVDLLSSMLSPNYKERPSLTNVADRLKRLIAELNKVSSPKISIISKDDRSCADIQIECEGAVNIYYTVDGSLPTKGSSVYTESLHITKTCRIKCVGESSERKLGPIAEVYVNIGKCLFKVSSKAPIIRVHGRNVEIIPNSECEEGTKLYYTLDGSRPTHSSCLYSRPFVVAADVIEVKAVAKEPAENKMLSMVVSAKVYKSQLYPPIIRFKKGLVTMESSDGASIFYTTNGDMPSVDSVKYESPFTVEDIKKFQIKAICIKNGSIDSEISEIKRPNLIMS